MKDICGGISMKDFLTLTPLYVKVEKLWDIKIILQGGKYGYCSSRCELGR